MKPGRKGLTWAYSPWESCQECAPCYSPVLASRAPVSSPTALAPFFSNLLQFLCLFVTLPCSFSLSLSTGCAPSVYTHGSAFLCKHISLKSHYPFTSISFILLQNVLKELNSLSSFHPNSYVDTLTKKALNITNTPTFTVRPSPNSLLPTPWGDSEARRAYLPRFCDDLVLKAGIQEQAAWLQRTSFQPPHPVDLKQVSRLSPWRPLGKFTVARVGGLSCRLRAILQ